MSGVSSQRQLSHENGCKDETDQPQLTSMTLDKATIGSYVSKKLGNNRGVAMPPGKMQNFSGIHVSVQNIQLPWNRQNPKK